MRSRARSTSIMPPTATRSISPRCCAGSLDGSSPSMPAASSSALSCARVTGGVGLRMRGRGSGLRLRGTGRTASAARQARRGARVAQAQAAARRLVARTRGSAGFGRRRHARSCRTTRCLRSDLVGAVGALRPWLACDLRLVRRGGRGGGLWRGAAPCCRACSCANGSSRSRRRVLLDRDVDLVRVDVDARRRRAAGATRCARGDCRAN